MHVLIDIYSCYGDESRCRLVLKRAVDSVQDLPDLVFGAYLSFEREKGTLDSLVAAEERVDARRAQLRRRAEKEKQMNLDKVRRAFCVHHCACGGRRGSFHCSRWCCTSVEQVVLYEC